MTEPNTITGQMQALIDDWRGSGDRREIFLSCYAMMTGNMLAAVQAGEFEDNAWVTGLLERFAGYYFEALSAHERAPDSAPLVWQVTFAACHSPHTHVLQNLILGVNAHINYDLVLALRDMLAPEWTRLTHDQREMRYRDHCRVNAIIAETIDAVQDQVIEREAPGLELVDRLMGRLDEWATARLITEWREEVWQDSVGLLRAGFGGAFSIRAGRLVGPEAVEQRTLEEVEQRTLEEVEQRALQEVEQRALEEVEQRALQDVEQRALQEVEQRALRRARAILGQAGLGGLAALL